MQKYVADHLPDATVTTYNPVRVCSIYKPFL